MDRKTDTHESIVDQIIAKYKGKVVTDSRSPAGNWLGLTVEEVSKGKATVSLPVKKEMTNPYGNIHGGMMGLVMDETIGWAVITLEAEHHYTSLNLNIDFLYAIKEGDRLMSTAEVIRAGKKIVHVECTIRHEDGTLLAKGTSNLIATSMQIK